MSAIVLLLQHYNVSPFVVIAIYTDITQSSGHSLFNLIEIRLLAKLRDYLDVTSAKSIYRLMVLPTFTYCGILQLKSTTTRSNRFASLYDCSLKVTQGNASTQSDITSVINTNNIRACKLVRKCTDIEACDIFRGYFEVQEHATKTRNNQCLKELPRVKTEYARKSFRFMGAEIYNELNLSVTTKNSS